MTTSLAPFSFLDPAYRRDPYPVLARLRAADPVHRSPFGWIVTRHADVARLNRDPRLGRDTRKLRGGGLAARAAGLPGFAETLATWMFHLDPPEHGRIRKLFAHAFTPRAIDRMLPAVERVADRLLAALPDEGEVDLIAQLARALPVTLIGALMDVPAGVQRQPPRRPRPNVIAEARYLPESNTTEYWIGTYEDIAPGVFHRLTGALSAEGLQILSAEIHTLADGLIVDRFYVQDPDYAGEPAKTRTDDVCAALTKALDHRQTKRPNFRKTWGSKSPRRAAAVPTVPTRVSADNATSDHFTVLDIFAADRRGLLYTIARTLYDMELSIGAAKIGTYVDQVVDVFYVTDRKGKKITSTAKLNEWDPDSDFAQTRREEKESDTALDLPRTPRAPGPRLNLDDFASPAPVPRTKVVDFVERVPLRDPAASIEDDGRSERFGSYTLLTAVGVGGMAEVRLALGPTPKGRQSACVVKRVSANYADHPDFLAIFKEESRIARLLDHPRIVRAFDAGEVDGVPFIAFELIDGMSLEELKKAAGGMLPVSVVLEAGIGVAQRW